ncbi:MAG TPA: Hsp20/alpha crystallin family protein [Thermodesulfobacteriota bacterium]
MKAITPFTPFSGLTTLRREMDRLFDRFSEFELPDLRWSGEWAPALDVSETRDAIVVKAEVPGIDPSQIEVTLEEGLLTIKGEKTEEKEAKEEQVYRKERVYGAFARAIRLPAAVDAAKVDATFKNGVLTVTLPKTPAAKGKTIQVKAA